MASSFKKRCKRGAAYVIWYRARTRALKMGKEFTISEADVKVPEFCPVLGLKLRMELGHRMAKDTSLSLDRIDNSRGYVPGNVRVISMRANTIKSDATAAELRAVADYVDREAVLSWL